ncbi:GlsB/YeaQ/YmgE family stress response membrane protein [Nostoc sp. 106C]|uniref:GlsB/YeaQ/YmgE family stress response membrane protein n=1 Tax=Nostoc sp. 106C TaxID=1932667 RepID=UPI000A37A246|nr:GlsB/YeaQ/YmgE family stress response membrane protein [Nostoc sp. 106C]OUL31020.1 transglycosylase [Nostoc sp. RF31YmG]OUL35282.1 transglycosylase [Nostoc sp. 106C]
MNIIAWVVLGLLAGAIAKAIYPGYQGGGILSTMVLGIVGAFIGGSLYTLLQTGTLQLTAAGAGFSLPGLFIAVIGAIIAIYLWGLLSRSSRV